MSDVGVTDHAADQYVARVKPLLSRPQARAELLSLIESHDLGAETTTTLPYCNGQEAFDWYLEIADGIAVAASGGNVVTVLVRAGKSPGQRKRKRTERREASAERRRQARRDRRDKTFGVGWPD